MRSYMACLVEHHHVATHCRHASKAYLECRMAHGLMAPEELERLGFGADADSRVAQFHSALDKPGARRDSL